MTQNKLPPGQGPSFIVFSGGNVKIGRMVVDGNAATGFDSLIRTTDGANLEIESGDLRGNTIISVDALQRIAPDVPLTEAFWWAIFGAWENPSWNDQRRDQAADRIGPVADKLRKLARKSRLIIWGRPPMSHPHANSGNWIDISHDHWESHFFDTQAFLRGDAMIGSITQAGEPDGWSQLVVRRSHIEDLLGRNGD